MLEDPSGRLLVYASCYSSREKRLKPISSAAEKVADLLRLNVEVVTFKERFVPIYVYYKEGESEPIPIYCDNDERSDKQRVFDALRNMMFVLSFHPRHTALKDMRNTIMRFS